MNKQSNRKTPTLSDLRQTQGAFEAMQINRPNFCEAITDCYRNR